MTTDTTPEAVERLAETMIGVAAGQRGANWCNDAASTLRALAAERDALRAERDKMFPVEMVEIMIKSAEPVLVEGYESELDALRAELADMTARRDLEAAYKRLARAHIETLAAENAALRADNDRLRAELADANETIVAYVGVYAARHAEACGLPKCHLAPHHYDILKKAGARMDSFTRAALDAKP